ncbi:MAG: exo-alpha-sialidase [Clostridia bacterium]|nr:exo-alpha-sialidase [Clostridia bacterium]MBR3716233.1 exo-alpha-sialidase [Clostridia bacterium]
MNITIKEDARIICSNPNGIHNYFGWPSVARLQDGSLMAVASGFRIAHVCPFGKVVALRSYDEGKSWTAPEVIIDTPLDDRDGGVMTFGDKGVIITSFNNEPSFQRRHPQLKPTYANAYLDEVEKNGDWKNFLGSTLAISDDGGKTFRGPYVVPISSPHGPCELSDGTVFYVGRLFDDNGSKSHIECHTLTPDAKTELRSRIEDISPELLSCEPHAIQLKNGRIVVHIRVQDYKGKVFTIYQSVSDDMGYTFTKPVQILTDKGGSPAHLIEHSSGALISVYGYREAPFGIRAMISYDNGETWETDLVITDKEPTPDLGYPGSVELEDGNILTVFYTRESKTSASVIKQVVWNFNE